MNACNPKTSPQAALVVATFVYSSTTRNQMLPRKPLPHPELEP
jgi:carboxypeptidase Q